MTSHLTSLWKLLSGHNFGSEHDPEAGECAPGDTKAEGGKYIMYPASVSGQLKNNKVRTSRRWGGGRHLTHFWV